MCSRFLEQKMFLCLINMSGPVTTQSAEVVWFFLISKRLNGVKEQMASFYTPSRKRQREAVLCSPGCSSLLRDWLSISSWDCSPLRESLFPACPRFQLAALSWFA